MNNKLVFDDSFIFHTKIFCDFPNFSFNEIFPLGTESRKLGLRKKKRILRLRISIILLKKSFKREKIILQEKNLQDKKIILLINFIFA